MCHTAREVLDDDPATRREQPFQPCQRGDWARVLRIDAKSTAKPLSKPIYGHSLIDTSAMPCYIVLW